MEITDNGTIQPLAVNDPLCSSDSVWYKDNENLSVSDKFDEVEAAIATKADAAHTHTEYASSSDLTALEDVINTKANLSHAHTEYASVNHGHSDYVTMVEFDMLNDEISSKADASHTHTEYSPSLHTHNEYAEVNHTHTEYATTTHTHSNYATVTALETLESEVDGKANSTHTHEDYAAMTHTHDDYASVSHTHTASEIGAAVSGHNHNEDYADINHNHDSVYAVVGHDHDEDYAAIDHTHTDYATTTSLSELSATVSGKANSSHTHDDIYYTETEIDTKLANKSDVSHTHTGVYEVSGAAANALSSAQIYTDSKIDALVGEGASTTLDTIGEISAAIEDNQDTIDLLNSAIANKANVSDLNSHANDVEIHITDAERESWNAKSDFSGNYNDLTNKPTIPSISGLATEVYVDEKVGGITVESIGALPDTTVIPTVPTNVSAFTNDAGYLTEHQSLDGLATETYVNTQIDAIDIPSSLSDLTTDSTHRTVTDAEKTVWNAKSNFSGSYNDLTDKPTIPSISGLATETYVDEAVSNKANTSHTHSISDVDGLQSALDAKSDSTHNHDTSYDAKGSANSALVSAKAYADELIEDEVANRDSAIATAKSSAISTAASDATTKANNALTSAKTYADSAVATAKNDLLNGAGAAYDTLKELGDLIDDNVDAIEALEAVAAGKANASHTHAISDITNLQSTLDGKAAASHGTHVSYSTTAPVMDGTASVGTATTVARSDHKHPTDTSRAAQTSLDSHTSNKSNPHGVTLAQLGLTATAAELNVLDGITATVTELNYVDGVTSNIQTQLNGKAASGHTHSYAGSSSVGGAATSANKLNTNAGDANTPVYFANGVPVACTSLDLNTTGNAATATNVAWSGVTSKPSYYDAKAIKSITRNGTTFTYTCMDGTTGTFTQQDNNTTYGAVTTSANGLMIASDKAKLDGMVFATVSEVESYLGI